MNKIRPLASFVRNLKEMFPDFLAFQGGRICNKSMNDKKITETGEKGIFLKKPKGSKLLITYCCKRFDIEDFGGGRRPIAKPNQI